MSVLRLLVLVSSILQILIGSGAAYRMLSPYQVDFIGLLLCSTVIAAGLASLSCLYVGHRPSISRGTVRRTFSWTPFLTMPTPQRVTPCGVDCHW